LKYHSHIVVHGENTRILLPSSLLNVFIIDKVASKLSGSQSQPTHFQQHVYLIDKLKEDCKGGRMREKWVFNIYSPFYDARNAELGSHATRQGVKHSHFTPR
jgi:hypothetical protein